MNFSLLPALLNFSFLPTFEYHSSCYSKRKTSHTTLHCPALNGPFTVAYLSNKNGCVLYVIHRVFEKKTLTGSHNNVVSGWRRSVFVKLRRGDSEVKSFASIHTDGEWFISLTVVLCCAILFCAVHIRAKFLEKRDDSVWTRKLRCYYWRWCW